MADRAFVLYIRRFLIFMYQGHDKSLYGGSVFLDDIDETKTATEYQRKTKKKSEEILIKRIYHTL